MVLRIYVAEAEIAHLDRSIQYKYVGSLAFKYLRQPSNSTSDRSLDITTLTIAMRLSKVLAGAALPLLVSTFTLSDVTSKAATTFAKRDTVSDILTDIEDAASCTACEV